MLVCLSLCCIHTQTSLLTVSGICNPRPTCPSIVKVQTKVSILLLLIDKVPIGLNA